MHFLKWKIFRCIFLNEKVLIQISLEFVHKVLNWKLLGFGSGNDLMPSCRQPELMLNKFSDTIRRHYARMSWMHGNIYFSFTPPRPYVICKTRLFYVYIPDQLVSIATTQEFANMMKSQQAPPWVAQGRWALNTVFNKICRYITKNDIHVFNSCIDGFQNKFWYGDFKTD